MPVTVLIVDDHPSFRATARLLLESEGFEVVGESPDGASGLLAARELAPDARAARRAASRHRRLRGRGAADERGRRAGRGADVEPRRVAISGRSWPRAARVAAPISALKTTWPSVDAGERASGADEFGDPGLVEQSAVAGHRRDADLLGEHRHARRHDRRPSRPCGCGGRSGSGAMSSGSRSVTISGWWARTSRAGPQCGSSSRHSCGGGLGGADDGGAAAAGPAGPVGEGAHGLGGGADRDEVGARVAERASACPSAYQPHISPPRRHGSSPATWTREVDEGVRDRLAVEDGERGVRGHSGSRTRVVVCVNTWGPHPAVC